MGRFVKMGDFFVQAVHRQGVLDQIVGAQAEKLAAPGQGVGDQRGGGDFDHGAGTDVGVERNLFLAQFGLVFLDQGIGLFQFAHAGDHGVHELDVSLHAGAENGAELGAEDFAFLQAKTDGAPAQKWVHFHRELEMGEKFVAA